VTALTVSAVAAPSQRPASADLERRFATDVRPVIHAYCAGCHGGQTPAAQLDLRSASSMADVAADPARWSLVLERVEAGQMPPAQARQPSDPERAQLVAWLDEWRHAEARIDAGDPGIVLARRLSNEEYNNTIRDLTGVDLRPAREFPVDPANPAGFDNSGESLAMSPALLTKYLTAAQDVANHVVFKPDGLAFAPHPMLVETDRDKYCVNQIVEFYKQQNTDYGAYFEAAWRFKHRPAGMTLEHLAASYSPPLSVKYLTAIWRTLQQSREAVGPIARLQSMWQALPVPRPDGAVPDGINRMRDYVVALRRKIAVVHADVEVNGLSDDAQPLLMWRNRRYADHRRDFDRSSLKAPGASADPDLQVPPDERPRYEAAFARFASLFPDAFYVSERGRYFPDNTRDVGRHLSAGFHNLMGYFRDDRPLYELLLDQRGQQRLDAMWRELDFIASASERTYVQFYLSESGEARKAAAEAAEGRAPATAEVTSEAAIAKVAASYIERARPAGNAAALAAIEAHFTTTNAAIRWAEKARAAAKPAHLAALLAFAERAYRRPLETSERDDLVRAYQAMGRAGLDHEDAIRDSIVAILVSPDFCYRVDLVSGAPARAAPARPRSARVPRWAPLGDYALASRLSYFLWASMPDAELMARAKAGDLRRPDGLAAQARRMLADPRVRGLATEFGGHWLDFRRFEEIKTVDRERFAAFSDDLRRAMFEEPIQFTLDVVRQNRSVLDFLFANHTFVNASLAAHYGMPPVPSHDSWIRVDDAGRYGRGGLLPMAAFLTKNAPGLRTSPVKRGYWVVKQVLGEQIPPPPAVVPELPRDEAQLDLPLRDLLARHRQDQSCASCHARFDALGLVFEGYGPIGERRSQDLSGRPVDASATFPGGSTGEGLDGLRAYLRRSRQDDFVDNLARKMLAYALNRSLMLSDEPAIDDARVRLAAAGYRITALIDSIITSDQFRHKRVE
jgi:hypothetical protein